MPAPEAPVPEPPAPAAPERRAPAAGSSAPGGPARAAAGPGSAPSAAPLLEVDGLRVVATGGPNGPAVVLDGVGLRVGPGECVGLVGESGSGKSLAVRAVAGLLPDGTATDGGSVRLSGRDALGLSGRARHALRGRRVTLLLQDPFTMLHPQLTCGSQIADGLRPELPALAAARGRRARREAARAEVARRLAEVGLEPWVAERYPHELSGGMRQRVAAAAALSGDPELLIADEPTTALDAVSRRAVLDLLRSLQRGRGMGLVLITHDLRVAFSACDRVYVLYAGSVLEQGPSALLAARPRHPYTAGLLLSEPSVRVRYERLPAVEGFVPPPGRRGAGCPFADRCAYAAEVCRTEPPRLRPVDGPPAADGGGNTAADGPAERLTACVRVHELGDLIAGSGRRAVASAPGSTAPGPEQRAAKDAGPRVPDGTGRTGPAPAPDTGQGPGVGADAGAPDTAAQDAAAPDGDRPALRMAGVRRTFRSAAGDHAAARGIDLTVPAGRITALIGESGSGKTTLARIAVGLETFDSGRVEVGGVPLTAGRRPARAERARLASRVQIVFQDPYSSLNPLRTVGATLTEALGAATRSGGRGPGRGQRQGTAAEVKRLLGQVGLPADYAVRRPAALSGGERQRVALARALAVRPDLLVCDEAVAALDVSVQAQLLNLLGELQRAEGFAVLFITHDLGVVRQIADEVAVMYRGELVERGPAAEVLDRPGHAWTRRMLAAVPE